MIAPVAMGDRPGLFDHDDDVAATRRRRMLGLRSAGLIAPPGQSTPKFHSQVRAV
jgi:hypothetical protein